MNNAQWIARFERNQLDRPEPPWSVPHHLPEKALPALRSSLDQFQLGDGGGPASLIAYDASKFRDRTPEMRRLVDLWFNEEKEHSRLLGCAVKRLGGRRIQSHWSFSAFCFTRKALGVRFELQVLLLTEIVSTAYYRVLRRHADDPALKAMCSLILRDESGHVSFHRDRLLECNPSRNLFWEAQLQACGYAAATMLWVNHGRCLKLLGATTSEYYEEVALELHRFISRLRRQVAAPTYSLVTKTA